MKFISARFSFAPAPERIEKRVPVIFVARSKSRMPSASPMSQCAFGVKLKDGFSPQVRSTRLCVSSGPIGTDSCGTFGKVQLDVAKIGFDRGEFVVELLDLVAEAFRRLDLRGGVLLVLLESWRSPSTRRCVSL